MEEQFLKGVNLEIGRKIAYIRKNLLWAIGQVGDLTEEKRFIEV